MLRRIPGIYHSMCAYLLITIQSAKISMRYEMSEGAHCRQPKPARRQWVIIMLPAILNEMQTTRSSFCRCVFWRAKYLREWVARGQKCLCDIIPTDAFDHGNESSINKCRLDFKRFRNKVQLNNSPADGYKCGCVCAFCNTQPHLRHTPMRRQV